MAEANDDWLSTSPIHLSQPASRGRSFTPGRALSRNEIREQRRRGHAQPLTFQASRGGLFGEVIEEAAEPSARSPIRKSPIKQKAKAVASKATPKLSDLEKKTPSPSKLQSATNKTNARTPVALAGPTGTLASRASKNVKRSNGFSKADSSPGNQHPLQAPSEREKPDSSSRKRKHLDEPSGLRPDAAIHIAKPKKLKKDTAKTLKTVGERLKSVLPSKPKKSNTSQLAQARTLLAEAESEDNEFPHIPIDDPSLEKKSHSPKHIPLQPPTKQSFEPITGKAKKLQQKHRSKRDSSQPLKSETTYPVESPLDVFIPLKPPDEQCVTEGGSNAEKPKKKGTKGKAKKDSADVLDLLEQSWSSLQSPLTIVIGNLSQGLQGPAAKEFRSRLFEAHKKNLKRLSTLATKRKELQDLLAARAKAQTFLADRIAERTSTAGELQRQRRRWQESRKLQKLKLELQDIAIESKLD